MQEYSPHQEVILRLLRFCLTRSSKTAIVEKCGINTRQFNFIIEPLKASGLISEEIIHFPVNGTKISSQPRLRIRIFYKTTHRGFLKLKRENHLW